MKKHSHSIQREKLEGTGPEEMVYIGRDLKLVLGRQRSKKKMDVLDKD